MFREFSKRRNVRGYAQSVNRLRYEASDAARHPPFCPWLRLAHHSPRRIRLFPVTEVPLNQASVRDGPHSRFTHGDR